ARLLGRVEDDHVEPLPVRRDLPQPGEQVRLHEAHRGPVEARVLPGEFDGLLIQVHADDLVRPAQGPGVDGEAARVAAQVDHAPAAAERGEVLTIVALVEEEARLVLAPRGDSETHAMLPDHGRRGRVRRAAVKRLLLLDVFLGEPVGPAVWEVAEKRRYDG